MRPELLTAEERGRFNAEYDRVTRRVYDVERSREAGVVYDERERLLDSYARQVGFRDDGFDRNVLSDIAARSGMYMQAGETDGTPTVVFTLPATFDGTSADAFLAEHYRLSGGGDTLDAALLKRIGDAHGGWAVYSDDMGRARASMLCSRLIARAAELKASAGEAESLDRVDVARLLDSYIGLLAGVHGAERTEQVRRSILDGTVDWDALLPKKDEGVSQSGYYVFLDTRTSRATVIDRAQAKYQPAMLEQAHIADVGDRISHISVFPGLGADGSHRLRCRIDGQGQHSVPLTAAQEQLWQDACQRGAKDAARLRLAAECFAGLLSLPAAVDRGMGGRLGR